MSENTKIDQYVENLANTHQMCATLLKTPHYAKMGMEGVFTIIQTAKSLGIDPMIALAGGLYYFHGKVEMSARQMNAIIRSRGHSITVDNKSDDKICIVHGKRKDTGDTCACKFTIEEARRIGLTKNPTWLNYPEDMLFARAISRLGRRLFPDLIGNCYVEGEIDDDKLKHIEYTPQTPEKSEEYLLTDEQIQEMDHLLDQLPSYKDKIVIFLEKKGITDKKKIPLETYEVIISRAKDLIEQVVE